ncbi:ATP-binding protein [Kribbella sp. CA-293567]|uniref:ATP-binding protein n=1 Tax=Kribbella sp. CA-293567 TaxID=3002436 RepID=UPI0022DD3F75|nr:XRE family transcriptional regulator [Kribbella sp. CA-293567]WBQ04083.1 tetratricopeptide repeat protein [Kribbella sp. CA-293567]
MSDFGPVLRGFRKAAGLSRERLADVSGVSVEGIKLLETGRRRHPRPATLKLLGDGLALSEVERAELVAAGARTKAGAEVPRQLPDDLADFSGRERQVAALVRAFAAGEKRPGVVMTSAIAGMGGIGKTALAVHVAHRLADRYPDGQLYLNLRGFGPGRPLTVEEALGRLTQSLGLRGPDDPHDVDEAASRYRSALAGRRVLVLLDNAVSAAQVAPLLPGASTCGVLITSRRTLSSLPGVARVALEVLPDQEALEMLATMVGAARVAEDRASALSIVRLCGGLPLALRIAGARLADEPSWSLADLNGRLDSDRRRLDELSIADLDVRAGIEFSLSAAAERDARAVGAFRLLGLHEGEELDLRVAAAVLDLSVPEADHCLERLVDLHLLESPAPQRYRMHDLIRSFVDETTAELTDEAARDAARLRVLRLYLAMTWRSRTLWFVTPMTDDWSEPGWTADVPESSLEELHVWLDEEIDEIIAAIRRAATGPPEEQAMAVRIVVGLMPYLHARRRYSDGVALGAIALAAAQSFRDPRATALVAFDLAQHCGAAGRYPLAAEHMTTALAVPATVKYEEMAAEGQVFLGEYLAELGRYEEAIASADRGIAGAVRLGDLAVEADGRVILGIIAGRQGRPSARDHEFERAVELVHKVGDANARRWVLGTVGTAYRESGRFDESLALFEECRTTALAAGDTFGVAEAVEDLGRTEFARGHLDRAEQHLTSALEMVRGTWQSEARVREHLARVLQAMGRPAEAAAQLSSAQDLAARHGVTRVEELRSNV